MAIDTLAYVKALVSAGVDRVAAEAHAEALTHHVLPDIATKADLEQLRHDLTVRVFSIVTVLNGVLFALLRWGH